ncbi:hypothetical protein D9619_003003 [Psilocybe cf. subviscida]|uniref:Alginate lyase domain-containing protein n=1 Tax=Psilocybe cf. subviscida TaxID=2480587 RepID=A0A8H5AXJ1_9AGAR|nr:hypothetical protein D9619_003003 [Psilocybe cf. subviscida]
MSVPRAILFATFISLALGDPNDWVNIDYVLSQAAGASSSTLDAQKSIIRNADKTSQKTWSVTNTKDTLPPSGDPHDYLSWAPYPPDQNSTASSPPTTLDPLPDDSYGNEAVIFLAHSGGYPVKRVNVQALNAEQGALPVSPQIPQSTASAISIPTAALPAQTTVSTASDGRTLTRGPAQAAAKTTKASCTPTPTKSLAPSATWTTCGYSQKDGQVDPDVRTLNGPDAINNVAQAVIYNAVAYGIKRTPTYARAIANMLQAFFVAPATRMNPNLNYGQVVRGPGPDGVSGTFTGILDLRGLVKIVNGICILKASGNTDWSPALDKSMSEWMTTYSQWLADSSIGKVTASRPNNHATFYVSQVVAAKYLAGDYDGAIIDLKKFFNGAFLDQIAHSGEQPFEAVRTRPYHYRNFNLEALITNAKLGDQLGINLWTSKSKYGATIQTAVDFIMSQNPGDEDPSQTLPHVASVAAAYGDPTGKYMAFLKKHDSSYSGKSFWLYDQVGAFPNSPGSKKAARSLIRKQDGVSDLSFPSLVANDVPDVPFACPAVFSDTVKVLIDNDLYVTCDELRPFYVNSALPT